MDIDAFSSAHQATWSRLDELCGIKRLSRAEADELLDLYQRTATHLSLVRTSSPDPQVVTYLSWLVARARARAVRVGRRGGKLAQVVTFFTETFPAALYRMRWWWLATLAISVVVAVALGWWFLANPAFETTMLDEQATRQLVERDFEAYYSEHAASSFAVGVFTNNAWVAAQCIAFGLLGAPVVYVLWTNIVNIAFTGSVMIRHGEGALFFGLITPHGLLELTAVFVAAGVGLRLFWGWIEPGHRTRLASVGYEARTAAGVVLGLVVVFFVSGLVEGFVTPSPLPTWARIAIGVLAELLFLAYVFIVGRRAAVRGVTGDVTGSAAVATVPARA